MKNLSWSLNTPLVSFEIQKEISRTPGGIYLELRTEVGLMAVWIPKKLASIYRYDNGSRTINELLIPEWFALRVGLIEAKE